MLPHRLLWLFAALLVPAAAAVAAELQPFTLDYKASYGSFDATASRSLTRQPQGSWEMKSAIAVKLLGTTVTSIEETSRFNWSHELPESASYSYVQKGLGGRKRSLEFDSTGHSATYTVNDKSGVLTLTPPAYDSLNALLVLRQQLQAGNTDISFTVADKGETNLQLYKVLDKASLQTPAGTFNTVHLQRIREGDNKRVTELWLASDFDYVLVKLVQTEPDGNSITLQLKHGLLGGQSIPLSGN